MDSSPSAVPAIHILHLESNPDDARLVQETLEAGGVACAITLVQNRQAFVKALEDGGVDLVLAGRLAALKILRSRWPAIPLIFVCGTLSEESAAAIFKDGSTDYVVRSSFSRIVPAVRRAMRDVEAGVELKRLEAASVESQKMEILSQLAGGAAHDFNNILSVIMSSGELLAEGLGPASSLTKYAEHIRNAAKSAISLTRQLLVFSRRQTVLPAVLDLNVVVRDLTQLLRRTIDQRIRLTIIAGKQIGYVMADAGNIGQVLMNLVVTARDAMPDGGDLTVATSSGTLDETHVCDAQAYVAGVYVILSVSDTGSGTALPGKGPGSGLATCGTIVRQAGGHFCFRSEPGLGTTFEVYLPRIEPPAFDT